MSDFLSLVLLCPGMVLFPAALILGAAHLAWTHGRSNPLEFAAIAPGGSECRRIGNVTVALSVAALLAPGLGYFIPFFWPVPVFSAVSLVAAIRLRRGSRLGRTAWSVSGLAWTSLPGAYLYPFPIGSQFGLGQDDAWVGWVYAIVAIFGCFGFAAIASQFAAIRRRERSVVAAEPAVVTGWFDRGARARAARDPEANRAES